MLKNWLSLTTITVTLAGVFAWSGTASASLIQNGSFEDPAKSSDGWDVLPSMTGWSATNGIERRRGSTVDNVHATDGAQYIELDTDKINGVMPSSTNTSIWQEVTLTAGTYRLSFDYASRTGDSSSDMRVQFGTLIDNIGTLNNLIINDLTSGQRTANQWNTITKDITVAGGAITLKFTAEGAANQYGAYLDNVKLTAVPVPAALPLFGSALLGLVFAGRRRSDRNHSV